MTDDEHAAVDVQLDRLLGASGFVLEPWQRAVFHRFLAAGQWQVKRKSPKGSL